MCLCDAGGLYPVVGNLVGFDTGALGPRSLHLATHHFKRSKRNMYFLPPPQTLCHGRPRL